MAAKKNSEFAEGSIKGWEALDALIKTNDEIDTLLQGINDTHAEIKKIKDMLRKNTAHGASHYCPFYIAESVDKFVSEQLHILMKPRFDLHKRMSDLQTCLMDEDGILAYNDDYFWALASEIKKKQELIYRIVNSFKQNQELCMFFQMMRNMKAMESQQQ